MKKAINIYFCQEDTKTKLNNIKQAGFDGVMLSLCNKPENMDLCDQISYCKTIGLEVAMIHCSYSEPQINSLWIQNDAEGDFVEQSLLTQVEQTKELGIKNFVLHTNSSFDTINTQHGLERIKRILASCEKYDINLCIENTYSFAQLQYIFDNITSKNLKLCYDSGHENFLTPKSTLIEDYHDLVATVHLHDNNGSSDEHIVLGTGSINIDVLARKLASCNFEFLTCELKEPVNKNNIQNFLKIAYNSLEQLDNKISLIKKQPIKLI